MLKLYKNKIYLELVSHYLEMDEDVLVEKDEGPLLRENMAAYDYKLDRNQIINLREKRIATNKKIKTSSSAFSCIEFIENFMNRKYEDDDSLYDRLSWDWRACRRGRNYYVQIHSYNVRNEEDYINSCINEWINKNGICVNINSFIMPEIKYDTGLDKINSDVDACFDHSESSLVRIKQFDKDTLYKITSTWDIDWPEHEGDSFDSFFAVVGFAFSFFDMFFRYLEINKSKLKRMGENATIEKKRDEIINEYKNHIRGTLKAPKSMHNKKNYEVYVFEEIYCGKCICEYRISKYGSNMERHALVDFEDITA